MDVDFICKSCGKKFRKHYTVGVTYQCPHCHSTRNYVVRPQEPTPVAHRHNDDGTSYSSGDSYTSSPDPYVPSPDPSPSPDFSSGGGGDFSGGGSSGDW